MKRLISSVLVATIALSAAAPSRGSAKELDQLTDRRRVLDYYAGGYRSLRGAPGPARVAAILDARMNELLDQLERELREHPPRDLAERDAVVAEVFQHRYVPDLVSPYEEWVKHRAHVPLYKVRDKGIFGHAVDYDDARMTWYIELSPILQLSGVLIGLDKLGHFLAQGFRYHQHYRTLSALPTSERHEALRVWGHATEVEQLGLATGGVYSFADLAANWAGFLFYRALFDDVDVAGDAHARYFEQLGDGAYRRTRSFQWSEWVRADWDEVLNPAAIADRRLFDKVVDNLRRRPGSRPSICDQFRADPKAYLGPHDPLIDRGRYAMPELAALVAPHALDVRRICAR